MTDNTSRRDLLKLAGTATITGSVFSEQVAAQGPSTKTGTVRNQQSTLAVQNHTTEEVTITVAFYETTESGEKARTSPTLSKTVPLTPRNVGPSDAKGGISIPDGEYIIEASKGGEVERSGSIKWGTAPWRDLVVRLQPERGILIASVES